VAEAETGGGRDRCTNYTHTVFFAARDLSLFLVVAGGCCDEDAVTGSYSTMGVPMVQQEVDISQFRRRRGGRYVEMNIV
jgi:hypothetical protein